MYTYDEVIVGLPKNINNTTFIPIYDIHLGNVTLIGNFFTVTISPKAIILEKNGEISIYKLDTDTDITDTIKSIIQTKDKE